jgi:hypothetical protein
LPQLIPFIDIGRYLELDGEEGGERRQLPGQGGMVPPAANPAGDQVCITPRQVVAFIRSGAELSSGRQRLDRDQEQEKDYQGA